MLPLVSLICVKSSAPAPPHAAATTATTTAAGAATTVGPTSLAQAADVNEIVGSLWESLELLDDLTASTAHVMALLGILRCCIWSCLCWRLCIAFHFVHCARMVL